jgi:hypothetical protein
MITRGSTTGGNDTVYADHGSRRAFTSADIGRKLRVAGASTGANNADHIIEAVLSSSIVRTTVATTPVTEEFSGLTVSITATIRSVTPNTDEDTFITTTRHQIASVTSESQIILVSDPTDGFGGTLSAVHYSITRDLSKTEEADAIAGYSTSLGSRRVVHTWPDILAVSVNGTAVKVPGYMAGAVLVGMVAGLPSQQGFTNMAIAGFVGREDSDDRYSGTQLDTIAGGGTLILIQTVPGAALEVRHQLTTDVSTIFFQELSITKNVDLVVALLPCLLQALPGHLQRDRDAARPSQDPVRRRHLDLAEQARSAGGSAPAPRRAALTGRSRRPSPTRSRWGSRSSRRCRSTR